MLTQQNQGLASHAGGVARLAAETAQRRGMSQNEVNRVRLAAELHDIGTRAIPASILDTPGALDGDEWQFIRRHTVIGERIVRAASSLSHAAPLIRSSHERLDGAGHPDGLRGDAIPFGARIIAVCDAFDAMVTARPYREATGVHDALAELRRCTGSQFDAAVIEEFCALATHRLDAQRAA